ncbi:MAG TPA: ABC transporter permease, partial [Acidimicrobiales bacterium]|nr:ABC transporter permease [Acidimicrobiales bacterium]
GEGGSGAVTTGASRSAGGGEATDAVATDAVVRQAVVAGIDAYAHAGAPGHDDTAVQVPATVESATRAPRRSSSDRLAAYDDEGDDADDVALAQLAVERSGVHPLRALRRSLGSGLGEAGEMSWLAASTVKSAVTRPRGYWGETREQIYSALKLCWVPMIVSITAFGIGAPGLQGGNVFSIFGVPEREGSFIVATGIREFAPWIDAMIIAGVVGTAITADIGARRIREEIDAMEVLGVDPLRELVVPRVLSTAIITGLFDIVALLVGILGGYIASVVLLGASSAGYVSQFFSQANVPDLLGSFVKTFLFGGIVGVVCCYKGLRASGGPAGVGKAVNQAVVISFALIWMVNYVFTNILLGFAPSTQAYH